MNMSKLHFFPLTFDLALHFLLIEAAAHMFIQYLNRFPLIEQEQQLLVHLNTTESWTIMKKILTWMSLNI